MAGSQLEFYGTWGITLLYLFFLLVVGYFYLKKKRPGLLFWGGLGFTFLLHGLLLLERWIRVGHGPYLTAFEVFSSNAWMVMACLFLLRFLFKKDWELLTISGLAGTLIFLLFSLERYSPEIGVPSRYFYIWLVIHVFFNKISLGVVILTLGYALALILGRARPETEALLLRLLMLTLISWTFTIVSGALWAHERWGRYWGWDPIETWSLIVWVLLALIIHGIRFFKISGKPLGILIFATILLFIAITAFLPYLVKTVHTMYLLGGE